MPPGLRKFALSVHLIASVGWIGAVLAWLALVFVTRTSRNPEMVRAALLALEPIYRYALVPLAVGALLTGIILSLGTRWGLFRHYWVVFSLLLTIFAAAVLLGYAKTVNILVEAAAAADGAEVLALKADLLHPIGGLAVLLVILWLNVYKPKGMTPYGLRKQQQERRSQPGPCTESQP